MEGLSGQDDPKTFDFGNDEYPLGQDLLVGDVNAVIDGLFAGGATEVHVVDGHGSGNPEPDIPADRLDSRAVQVLRDESFDAYFDLVEPGAYDAVVLVGMHAKTGSGGFASHTYTLGMDFIVNGRSITETELVALSWGRVGVPVIFASGDDRLAGDLETMPWVEYVTVKQATSASTANARPLEEARADLRGAAQRAVENLRAAKVMQVVAPIKATLRAVRPASLERLERFPGIDYADNSVTFVASDIADAYEGFQGIVRVATSGYYSVLFEQLRARQDMGEIWAAWTEALMARWFDVESGRWQPEEEEAEPAGERKYHGFQ
jgi:D-amino peptidase